jgi:hypothetical protein
VRDLAGPCGTRFWESVPCDNHPDCLFELDYPACRTSCSVPAPVRRVRGPDIRLPPVLGAVVRYRAGNAQLGGPETLTSVRTFAVRRLS